MNDGLPHPVEVGTAGEVVDQREDHEHDTEQDRMEEMQHSPRPRYIRIL